MTYNGKVLVVGATGTIGKEVLVQLSACDIRPCAMVRNAGNANLSSDYVDVVEADLGKPESLDKALEGVDRVFITTAIHPDAVTHFTNFFDAAVRAGVENLVKVSAIGADPASRSEILRQHGESDERLRKSGLKYTILRSNSFFQNMLFQARQINRRSKFSLPLGDSRQSLVDVRDIAEVAARSLTECGHENKVYDLTGSESLSCNDIADHLSAAINRTITYLPISAEMAKQSMQSAGAPEWNAAALTEIQQLFSTGAFSDTTEEVKLVLGREPRQFSEFAVEHMSCF